MAVELIGVLAGGSIGLVGGLGGVLLGHLLSRRRDSISRSIEGLRLVVGELNRFSRLGLFFEQQINIGLQEEGANAETCAKKMIGMPEWLKATYELQETHWRFPCMAYLPNAIPDFQEIDRLMLYVMDPYARYPGEDHEMSSDQAWDKFKAIHQRVQQKVEARLRELL